jgi:hypothetical protein
VRAPVTVCDPIGKGKRKQHDNEDFKKRVHDAADDLVLRPTQFKANNGFSNLDLDQITDEAFSEIAHVIVGDCYERRSR